MFPFLYLPFSLPKLTGDKAQSLIVLGLVSKTATTTLTGKQEIDLNLFVLCCNSPFFYFLALLCYVLPPWLKDPTQVRLRFRLTLASFLRNCYFLVFRSSSFCFNFYDTFLSLG